MTLWDFYKSIGADEKIVLQRFLSEALAYKFLKKLPADPTYFQLKESLSHEDYEQAFRHAHTLKGVSLNLELKDLAQASSRLTDLLRNPKEVDINQVHSSFKELESVYNQVVAQIAAVD